MSCTAVIQNPPIFVNLRYLKQKVFQNEYSIVTAEIIYQNEIPRKIILTFPFNGILNGFISTYNGTFFEEDTDIELKIERIESSEIAALKEQYKDKPYKKITYQKEYDKMILLASEYEKSSLDGGFVYLDEFEKAKITRGIAWIIKRIGSYILSGQSILNISLPVFVFDPRTLQEVFAYEHRLAPYFLSHAAHCNDTMEKLKWVTAYMLSFLHMSCFQTKPFNPILGETFQCRIGSMQYYTEQVANHPITYNIYCKEDEGLFTVHGYILTSATTNPNSVNAIKKGKCQVTLKDGTTYTIHIPMLQVKGTTLGKRIMNYIQKGVVIDDTHNLAVYISMNPDEVSYLRSWIPFAKKQQTPPDKFIGKVVSKDDVVIAEKDCMHVLKEPSSSTVKLEVSGEWTQNLIFDNEDEYWDIDDYEAFSMYELDFMLPSDGRNRPDLQELLKGDEEKSQMEKEKLEVLQRKDRKLRAAWKEKEGKGVEQQKQPEQQQQQQQEQ